MDTQARASAKPEDWGLEGRCGTQVPLGVETLRVLVLFLVHVHRPDVRHDDGTLGDAITFCVVRGSVSFGCERASERVSA